LANRQAFAQGYGLHCRRIAVMANDPKPVCGEGSQEQPKNQPLPLILKGLIAINFNKSKSSQVMRV
jgi:hypothetical protein